MEPTLIMCTGIITCLLLYMLEFQKRVVFAWWSTEIMHTLKNEIKNLHYNTVEEIVLSSVTFNMIYSSRDEKERFFNTLKATAQMHWIELKDERKLIFTENSISIEK